jgi:hypothetical protein
MLLYKELRRPSAWFAVLWFYGFLLNKKLNQEKLISGEGSGKIKLNQVKQHRRSHPRRVGLIYRRSLVRTPKRSMTARHAGACCGLLAPTGGPNRAVVTRVGGL